MTSSDQASSNSVKSLTNSQETVLTQIGRIEEYFDKLEDLEKELSIDENFNWIKKIERFVFKIVDGEVGLLEAKAQKASFFKKILASSDCIEIFEGLLDRINYLSQTKNSNHFEDAESLQERKDVLVLLQAFIHLYAQRKYSLLAMFGPHHSLELERTDKHARLFGAEILSGPDKHSRKGILVDIGLFCRKLAGQTVMVRARAVVENNTGKNGDRRGEKNSNVTSIYYPVWSNKILESIYIEDRVTIEIPLHLINLVDTDSNNITLELGLFSNTGECLDKIKIEKQRRQQSKLARQQYSPPNSPNLSSNSPVRENEPLQIDKSIIHALSLTYNPEQTTISYDLKLVNPTGGGWYVVFEFLDEHGEILYDNRSTFFKPSLSSESGHENNVPYKLSFKRFIPATNPTNATIESVLKLKTKRLGLGWMKKSIYLNVILFTATQEKLDQREERFSISRKSAGKIPGKIRLFKSLFAILFTALFALTQR